MPEMKTITVPVAGLQVGDRLNLGSEIVVVTGRPDVKSKYAYIPVEGRDRPLRLSLDFPQIVIRELPTEEEAALAQYERSLKTISNHIETITAAVEEAKQRLIGELGIKDPSWHGRAWESYARLQIEAELWASVTIVASNREIDLVEATTVVRDHTIENFTTRHNFLPRSTSAISNHVEALRNDVTANWLRDLVWIL